MDTIPVEDAWREDAGGRTVFLVKWSTHMPHLLNSSFMMTPPRPLGGSRMKVPVKFTSLKNPLDLSRLAPLPQ